MNAFLLILLLIEGSMYSLGSSLPLANNTYPKNVSLQSMQQSCNDFNVIYHRCYWDVTNFDDGIIGVITTYFIPVTTPMECISFDMHNDLIPDSVTYHGMKMPFVHLSNKISIYLPEPLDKKTVDSITISYHGVPQKNEFDYFAAPYLEGMESDVGYYARTFSEPYFAKEWWPCKESLLDKIDSIDVFITTLNGLLALSNGTLQGTIVDKNFTTFHWRHRYPIATYLVGFAVGNYTVYEETLRDPKTNTKFSFKNYLYKGDSTTKIAVVNEHVQRMQQLIDTMGFYPFTKDGYSQTAVKYYTGGMEHQTNSFLGNTWSKELILHEFAHQWFGDYVTCSSWKDLWLHESFSTYFQLYDVPWPELGPYNQFRINLTNTIIQNSPNDRYVYKVDTLDVVRLFNNATYNKGAYVLDMLEYTLGWPAFIYGIRTYLNDTTTSYGNANTSKLKRSMEKASSKDLSNFFDSWIYGNYIPEYSINWFQHNDSLRITISQNTDGEETDHFIHMPIEFVAKGKLAQMNFKVDNTKNNQYFSIPSNFNIDSLNFNPNHRILCKNNKITQDSTLLSNSYQSSLNHPFSFSLFSDEVVIEDNVKSNFTKYAEIRDMTGKRILFSEFQGQLIIPISRIADGIYLIHVYGNFYSVTKKFLVTHQEK